MTRKGIFITGTDTDVGKTVITGGLLNYFCSRGFQAGLMKVVQTGCIQSEDKLIAPDLEFSLKLAGKTFKEQEKLFMCPYKYKLPCSPHLAAEIDRTDYPDSSHILDCFDQLASEYSPIIVEGAGGLLVPINKKEKMIDLIKKLDIPVILVSKTELGTLNHTLLSLNALSNAGLTVLGVIFNNPAPVDEQDAYIIKDNIKFIEHYGNTNVLGVMKHVKDINLNHVEANEVFKNCIKCAELESLYEKCLEKKIELNDIKKLRKDDIKYLWHPYTDIEGFGKSDFPIMKRGEGVFLYDLEGKRYYDGISSWWCVNFGHSRLELIRAIQEQSEQMQHSILGGISHSEAICLSKKLADITPHGLNHAYYAGDGSSATEAALKIALQYWCNIGINNKNKFVCLESGYHGDTLGAVGVGYVETFHKNFDSVISKSYRAISPHCAECPFGKKPSSCSIECFNSMKDLITKHYKSIAAAIVEPLCQGAAGIRIYPEKYLQQLRDLCNQYGILLIADEIAVGFGRTGSMFACNIAGISPDIMLLGKGLTGGYLPMSAVMVTDDIYNSFKSNDRLDRTLYHGHTFSGNPITSHLALAALNLYEDLNIINIIQPRIKQFKTGMVEIGKHLNNSYVSTLGMIGAVHLNKEAGTASRAKKIRDVALSNGLIIRPLGNTIYLWPPLVSTEDEIDEMLSILKDAVFKTI